LKQLNGYTLTLIDCNEVDLVLLSKLFYTVQIKEFSARKTGLLKTYGGAAKNR